MWKTLANTVIHTRVPFCNILKPENVIQDQIRTTFILRRKNQPRFHKQGANPKKLKQQHYIYELVKDTLSEKKPNIDVILREFVDGLGNPGQRVSVKPHWAYDNLLLPGLAVYASPENVEKYEDKLAAEKTDSHSSPTASLTAKTLSRIVLSVVMNMEEKWTLEPWHVRASFRKCGYAVPDEAITLPQEVISGPDMELENKEFYVTVTINNLEQVNVRCRIHHWSTDIKNRLQFNEKFWLVPAEPIFEEQKEQLQQMPKKCEKVVY